MFITKNIGTVIDKPEVMDTNRRTQALTCIADNYQSLLTLKDFVMKKLLALLLLTLSTLSHAETLMIAAGAGYKRPTVELARGYESTTGNKVEEFYGNMAQVLTQARQSGKVALVLGDLDFLQKTTDVSFSNFLPLGDGKLVLAYAKGKTLKNPQALLDSTFTRIALPDTRNAVYGKAAEEYLSKSALASQLKAKLLVVSTVPQVSAYLVSAEVDAGFINITDALSIKDKIGGFIEIDPQSYGSIKIVAGIIKGREADPATKAFAEYLRTPLAHSILEKHGL